jgi:hypothetical protein
MTLSPQDTRSLPSSPSTQQYLQLLKCTFNFL